MMKDISCYTDHDSHRSILSILVPTADVDRDDLVLLSEMLHLAPETGLKGSCLALAGLSLSFRPVVLGKKNALLVAMDQTEDKSLTYLFKDPYRQVGEVLSHLLKEGFAKEDSVLAQAKRRVLRRHPLPADRIAYANRLPLVLVVPDAERLPERKLADVEKALSCFASSQVLKVYSGSAKRDFSLPYPSFSKAEDFSAVKDIVLKEKSDGESLLLELSHRPLSSLEDFFSLLSAHETFKRSCSLYFRRMMLADIDYRLCPVSPEKSAIVLSFASDNLSLLRRQIPFKAKESLPFLYDRARSDDVLFRQEELLLNIDRERYLALLLSLALLSLPPDGLFAEHKGEGAKDIYESMKIEAIAWATLGGRK